MSKAYQVTVCLNQFTTLQSNQIILTIERLLLFNMNTPNSLSNNIQKAENPQKNKILGNKLLKLKNSRSVILKVQFLDQKHWHHQGIC